MQSSYTGFSERLVKIATTALEEISDSPDIPYHEKLAALHRIERRAVEFGISVNLGEEKKRAATVLNRG